MAMQQLPMKNTNSSGNARQADEPFHPASVRAGGFARGSVIGVPVSAASWVEVEERVAGWARFHRPAYVCTCNVHVVVTATREPALREAIELADIACPDGAPIAWALRRSGFPAQERIAGPDLMWRLCGRAAAEGLSVFLHGSTEQTLEALKRRLRAAFPALRIAGTHAPPFHELSETDNVRDVQRINASGAHIVFVGLGCPKQELWMANQRGRVKGVMIGVGAAFDFHAGIVPRAPVWMQRCGLEWLYRLHAEPKRLWRRYLVTNSLFLWMTLLQRLGRRS